MLLGSFAWAAGRYNVCVFPVKCEGRCCEGWQGTRTRLSHVVGGWICHPQTGGDGTDTPTLSPTPIPTPTLTPNGDATHAISDPTDGSVPLL